MLDQFVGSLARGTSARDGTGSSTTRYRASLSTNDGSKMVESTSPVVPRPGTITAAAVLWIVLGVWMMLAGVGTTVQAFNHSWGRPAWIGCGTIAVVGALLWRLGTSLWRGRDVRTRLVVWGALSCFLLVTVIFVVPALVLQYHPRSRRWFALPAPLSKVTIRPLDSHHEYPFGPSVYLII